MTQPELRREAGANARREIVGRGLQYDCQYAHDHCAVFDKGPCGLELIEERTESILREQREAVDIRNRLIQELAEAEQKAWDSLGRYKFQMFGYWAGVWIHLNKISGQRRPNPWRELTKIASEERTV